MIFQHAVFLPECQLASLRPIGPFFSLTPWNSIFVDEAFGIGCLQIRQIVYKYPLYQTHQTQISSNWWYISISNPCQISMKSHIMLGKSHISIYIYIYPTIKPIKKRNIIGTSQWEFQDPKMEVLYHISAAPSRGWWCPRAAAAIGPETTEAAVIPWLDNGQIVVNWWLNDG